MVEGERCPCSDSEKDWEMVGLPMRWGPRKKGKFRYRPLWDPGDRRSLGDVQKEASRSPWDPKV